MPWQHGRTPLAWQPSCAHNCCQTSLAFTHHCQTRLAFEHRCQTHLDCCQWQSQNVQNHRFNESDTKLPLQSRNRSTALVFCTPARKSPIPSHMVAADELAWHLQLCEGHQMPMWRQCLSTYARLTLTQRMSPTTNCKLQIMFLLGFFVVNI